MSDTTYLESRTLTAFFDERDDAQEAVQELRALGIPDASVRMAGGEQYASASREDDRGFWESLADLFFPDDDRETYAEGLRRGGYLVTASAIPADLYDRALDILDDEGSIDMDQRAETWRSEGWTGRGATAAGPGGGLAATGVATGATGMSAGDHSRSTTGQAFSSDAQLRDTDEVIPVVEEQLRIGKRDVNLGRVRVRSYVVEEPVSEDVTLRQDRVEIERRPVDRTLRGDERAFTDRTIEAEEHAEEAVVQKDARVTEEIALRRESQERTETVSDTVRHTEVEVEDERGQKLGTGTGTQRSRI